MGSERFIETDPDTFLIVDKSTEEKEEKEKS